MRKPPVPKIIVTPPDDTGKTQKESNSESNEKDEIWIELKEMSPQKKKKSTDKSCDITPKNKKNKTQRQRNQRMKMEKSQFKCSVIFNKL